THSRQGSGPDEGLHRHRLRGTECPARLLPVPSRVQGRGAGVREHPAALPSLPQGGRCQEREAGRLGYISARDGPRQRFGRAASTPLEAPAATDWRTMMMTMIKRLLMAISLLFITAAVSRAQEPIEPARHRFVARILLGAGHEIVQSFRDCRTDKLWCAAVISTIGLNLTDSAVSCRAKSYGNWYEQNPLLGSN